MNGLYQIIHHLIFAAANILHHTGTDVLVQQLPSEGIQCRLYGGHLSQDIGAIGVLFQHILQSAHLSLNTAQTVLQCLCLLGRAVFGLMRTTAVAHSFTPFRRRALVTTNRELRLIASAPIIGESSK